MSAKFILIVENDPDAREAQVEFWKDKGYTVLEAGSPRSRHQNADTKAQHSHL